MAIQCAAAEHGGLIKIKKEKKVHGQNLRPPRLTSGGLKYTFPANACRSTIRRRGPSGCCLQVSHHRLCGFVFSFCLCTGFYVLLSQLEPGDRRVRFFLDVCLACIFFAIVGQSVVGIALQSAALPDAPLKYVTRRVGR